MNKFKQLLLEPLYVNHEFTLLTDEEGNFISAEDAKELFELINIEKNNVKSMFCDKCGSEMPFKVTSNVRTYSNMYNEVFEIDGHTFIRIDDGKIMSGMRKFIIIKLNCNHIEEHNYIFYFEVYVREEKLIFRKVGQTPENYIIDNYQDLGLRKQLTKIGILEDFKNIHIMLSHSYNVCSLLYIRRTLEKTIEYLLLKLDNDFDLKCKFDDKMKYLKENSPDLSPDLHDISTIMYKLSSQSIHNLTDDDSEQFIEPIFEFILVQLNHMKNRDETKLRIKEGKRRLKKLGSKM